MALKYFSLETKNKEAPGVKEEPWELEIETNRNRLFMVVGGMTAIILQTVRRKLPWTQLEVSAP